MIVAWNSKKACLNIKGLKSRESVTEHNKRMKRFHQLHSRELTYRAAMIEKMQTYNVKPILTEKGGATGFTELIDWSTLMPVRRITEQQFTWN